MALDMNELLTAAAHHWQQNRHLWPMYLHLLLAALFPIYTGAHASLSRPSSAAKPEKKKEKEKGEGDNDEDGEDEEEEEEEETIQQIEGLTPRDALIFPLMAGTVLAGLYWLIKTYGAGIINTVLGLYFSLIGTYSVAKLINDSWITMASLIMPRYYSDQGKIWKVQHHMRRAVALGSESATRTTPFAGPLGRLPLPAPLLSFAWRLRDVVKQRYQVKGFAKHVFEFKIVATRLNAASGILGISAIIYSLLVDKPWWLTNLQGFGVCYGALQLMSPTTFATGSLILSGLFFYDIWAVFFTPLMVTVATNLDVPIKLVFPRPQDPSAAPGEQRAYSMLGLGDIVLPGLMIGLCLRFDLYMHYLRKQKQTQKQVCDGDVCTPKTEVEKAPYVTVSGKWGDKLWIRGSSHLDLPAALSISFNKPYFSASMIGYVIGMIATLVFMSIFRHAQPALLYLVPGVLISTWATGLIRGELKEMWNFSEAITGEAEDDDEKEGETTTESKGLFADLWADLFGSSEKEETNETKKGSDDSESNNPKPTDRAETDPDSIFFFEISRCKRGAAPEAVTSVRSASASRASSNLEDEDSVLVSRPDPDAEETQPRFRVVSTQQGTAEKHQRLS